MDKRQLPQKRPPKKERKRKKLRLDAAAQEQGRIEGQIKAHAKKPLTESVKEHLGHLIDNLHLSDAIDLATLYAFYLKYDLVDHHGPTASFCEAAVDLALLKSHTEAGTISVLVHMGITEIPNIAAAIDKAIREQIPIKPSYNLLWDMLRTVMGIREAIGPTYEFKPGEIDKH